MYGKGVEVAAYSRLASRSQAKFHTMKLRPLVRPCAAAPAQSTTSAYRSLDFRRTTSSQRGRWVGSWPLLLHSVHEDTYMQVIFIKNIVAVAAYRSCRLWRWVKMPWIHYVLCNHHWTQCRHALSDTSHVPQVRILEDPRWPPKCRWQDVR